MFLQCVPVCSLVPGDQARHDGPGSSNHITLSLGLQHNQGAAQLTGLFNQKSVILLHIVDLYFISLNFAHLTAGNSLSPYFIAFLKSPHFSVLGFMIKLEVCVINTSG